MKEELKQAIEEAYRISSSDSWIQKELQHSKRLAVELAMSDISILRHADPDVMKKAGWVREDEEVLNNNKAILIDSFIEHCKELNIKIPDYAFESFFNA